MPTPEKRFYEPSPARFVILLFYFGNDRWCKMVECVLCNGPSRVGMRCREKGKDLEAVGQTWGRENMAAGRAG